MSFYKNKINKKSHIKSVQYFCFLGMLSTFLLMSKPAFSQELATVPEQQLLDSQSEIVLEEHTQNKYIIRSVTYNIKGITNQRILQGKAGIQKGKQFESLEDLDRYLADRRQRLMNERVLASVQIKYSIIESNSEIKAVDIGIEVEDSWNIIALPYFRYDSNDGFLLSIRGRDYNFLGSMQALVLNLDYSIDASGKQSYGGYASFGVPFELLGRDSGVNISETLSVHAENKPITAISNISFWHRLTKGSIPVNFEASQGLYLNPDAIVGDPDPYLLFSKITFSSTLDTGLSIGSLGLVNYSPSITGYQYWRPDTPVRLDRQGLRISFSHGLSFGRIDWIENMRRGLTFGLTNSNTYNLLTKGFVSDLDASLSYSATAGGEFGFNARLTGFDSLTSSIRGGLGSSMRGIKNDRLQGPRAAFINIETPVKLFDFPMHLLIKKNWFDFEMQFSPFADFGFVQGTSGTVAEVYNYWYSGGFEFFVFPLRMRTFIVRASLGFDLDAVLKNMSFSEPSLRDGAPIYELFFGLGLFL